LIRRCSVEARLAGERLQRCVGAAPPAERSPIVGGSGRSGTTWLADLLCAAPGVQQIFEPLSPAEIPEITRLTGWRDGCPSHIRSWYLSVEETEAQWIHFLADVLSGRIRNHWTDSYRTSYFPRRYLIKLIRGNLMLGFMQRHFSCPIAIVVRHPCAVVNSRLQLGWHADVRDVLSQERLVERHLRPWIAEIEHERDPVGAHAVWWAVENYVALRELSGRPHHAFFYERACINPRSEIGALARWFDIEPEDVSLTHLSRPGRQARQKTPYRPTPERLWRWRNDLSDEQAQRVLSWAKRLGLDWYGLGPLPGPETPALTS